MTRTIDEVARAAIARHYETEARLVAMRDALRPLVALVTRQGGFLTYEDQQTLHNARAALVEENG